VRLRDREQINASILTTAGSGYGAILTKRMFSSYLTHSQVLQYSKTLIERGFLEYDKIDKVYKTTPFGFRFLELHGEMSQILNVQQELELSRR
jgi:predicted transcriptional regulator